MQKSVNFLELISGGRIPEVLIGTWIVMGILLVFGFLARASLASQAEFRRTALMRLLDVRRSDAA